MRVHQRQSDCVARILVAGLFFSALTAGTLPLTAGAFAQTSLPAGLATAKLPAVAPLSDSELPPLPAVLRSTHEKLARQAQDAVRACDDKAIRAAIEAIDRYQFIRIKRGGDSTKQDDALDEYKQDVIVAREKCRKRASTLYFADAVTATRIRYQLSKMNDAIGRCDRAAYQLAIKKLVDLRILRQEDFDKAAKRGNVGQQNLASSDIVKFTELINNLVANEAEAFKDCPPKTQAVAGSTPPAGGTQVKVETGGSAGRCVITEGGSIEELKVGEKPGGQIASPPKAPAPPTGQTAETPKSPAAPPEKKTAETPKTPAPTPEKKTAEVPTTPAEKKPPEKPSSGPTPEKTAGPPAGETTIFVKASDTVAFGNGAGTGPLAGAVVRLAGLGTTPALPQQGETRTAEAENNGASSSPTQCRTDGNGQCTIKVNTDDFVDPNDDTGKAAAKPPTKTVANDPIDPIDLPDKQDKGGDFKPPKKTAANDPIDPIDLPDKQDKGSDFKPPKKTAANDPTDPIDLPDKQDKGSDFSPPKKTAANDPTDPIDLPDKQDKGSDFSPPKQAVVPDDFKVGAQLTVPGTSPATATLELKAKRNDSVVVKGAAAQPSAPKKQGRLDDNDARDFIRVAAANVPRVSPQSMNDVGGMKLAQQPSKQDAADRAANDEVRPPPGTEVTIERIKVGDREYFRINGQGFGDGALAEWVKTTWGFTVIIDPCRDPQPGPPVGMTPQNSCGPPRSGSRAGASAEAVPSANLVLAARSRAVP